MAIPRRRLALGGGALLLLTAVGVGFVQASTAGAASPPAAVDAAVAPPAATTDQADALSAALRLRGRGRIVHGTVTIDSPKDGLITVQIDGGTIAAVDAHSITIAEKVGGSVMVAIDSDTRIRRDRKRATTADPDRADSEAIAAR